MTKAQKAIDAGMMLKSKGVKYKLGAKAMPPKIPALLDCSGFIVYCFKVAGVSIPDGTYYQFYSTAPVDISKIKVGDLGFLQDPSAKGTNHVGIYVGKGNWMHCNYSRNGITVEPTKMFNKHIRRCPTLFDNEKETKIMIEVTDKERGYAEAAIKHLYALGLISNPDKHISDLNADPSNWALWVVQSNIADRLPK